LCSLFSFFCFAISAEGTTTAFDEWDALKYVYYLLWYNVSVILLGAAIALHTLTGFERSLINFASSEFICTDPAVITIFVKRVYAVIFLALLSHWIRDVFFLLFKDTDTFNEYLKELNDNSAPELHRRLFMRLIFRRRIKNEPAAT
jgi:hypothetical protein